MAAQERLHRRRHHLLARLMVAVLLVLVAVAVVAVAAVRQCLQAALPPRCSTMVCACCSLQSIR